MRLISRFLPEQHDFFADFEAVACNAVAMGDELVALFAAGGDAGHLRRMADLEHVGDQLTHDIYTALAEAFVPELGVKDLHVIVGQFDNFVDGMEEAGKRYLLFQLAGPTPVADRLAHINREQALLLQQAMRLFGEEKPDPLLQPLLTELHELENEADRILQQTLGTLYDGVTDVSDVIRCLKWGDVYELLENATDHAERIASSVEEIIGQRS
jgi:uncharacterized protein